MADILSRPLDRSRPLWELHLVEGLAEGRFALVTKVHHAAVDGVSGIELMTILLSPEPSLVPERVQPPVSTESIPGDGQMLVNALGDLIRHPPWFARPPLDATSAPHDVLMPAGELPRRWKSPLNATITPHRSVTLIDVPLDAVRTVKHRVGCTVNDVVLALCAGALRRLIDRSGVVDAPSLVAGVPVSIRTAAEKGAMGNRVSFMLVPLATDIAAPLGRLHAIHAHTSAGKERHDPVAARALMNWSVAGGPPLVAQAARLYSQLRVADVAEPDFHVVVSNIPGPTGPLYCASSSMTALYPTGPLGEGAGLNITFGQLCGPAQHQPDHLPRGCA